MLKRLKTAGILLMLLPFIGTMACNPPSRPEPAAGLTVHAFSAGSADALLLTTKNSSVLIDCGESDFGGKLVDLLRRNGVQRLDYLIITHFDKDHVGGAARVIRSLPVGRVLQSNVPKDSNSYQKYLSALEKAGLEPETVSEEMDFELDGVRYSIVPPAKSYANNKSNNSSLIVSVVHGSDSLLFMGDAEDERITEFLAVHRESYDFLKVPHHGRLGGMTASLIASVKPEFAVITSSKDEPEDAEVISMLQTHGAEVFLTRNGSVVIESSGNGVSAHYE